MTTGLAPAPVQAAGDLRAGSSSRLPGLDGMRGIAILAVLTFHLNSQWLSGGFLGVDIFFVISGFLITSLLVKEHRWTGRIDLRRRAECRRGRSAGCSHPRRPRARPR